MRIALIWVIWYRKDGGWQYLDYRGCLEKKGPRNPNWMNVIQFQRSNKLGNMAFLLILSAV